MEYGTNTGLIFTRTTRGIVFYSTSSNLRKTINSGNSEFLWRVLNYLYDPHSLKEIQYHFGLDPSQASNLVEQLLINNLVIENPTNRESRFFRLDRFVNSIPDLKYRDYKERISKIKVVILGLGTAGSYAIELLSKIGITNFIIIDCDKVEERNLISQNYNFNDVGKYKTESLKEKYDYLEIISITQKIENYSDLKRILSQYKADYLLSNADDGMLIIEILSKIFHDFPDIKIIESGYSISDVQAEIISKENVHYFKTQFENLANFYKENGEFDGIADNSGIIFHSILDAFFSAKFIFDDITHIASSEFAQFNLIENKYFLDNLFYRPEFEKYIQRYRSDSTLTAPQNERKNIIKVNPMDSAVLLYFSEEPNWKVFENFLTIREEFLSTGEKDEDLNNLLSTERLKKLLYEYCQSFSLGSLIDTKKFDTNLVVLSKSNKYNIQQIYSEHVGKLRNRIYLCDCNSNIDFSFIREYFICLGKEIGLSICDQQEFYIKNSIYFTQYCFDKDKKIGSIIGTQLIKQSSTEYIDTFEKINYVKSVYLHQEKTFISRLSNVLRITEKEAVNYISRYQNQAPESSDVSVLHTMENSWGAITSIEKAIKNKER